MGGKPVFPRLPDELVQLRAIGSLWPLSDREEQRRRRSLYVMVRRNLRYPFFEAFDRPDTNASCSQRSVTTIAPQALTLWNSTIAHDAAEALARRVSREAGPDQDARVRLAFRLCYSREPDRDELSACREFLARDPSLVHFGLAIINANEFVYVD